MIRRFATHHIRPQRELGGLWRLTPQAGPLCGSVFQAPVPGCWESLPGLESYRGEADYETTFEAGGNLRLEFKGVSHTATVYLDGEELGGHYNAYTPFSFLAMGVPGGTHHLRVRVSNAFGPESALHVPNDYYAYGGISRPVALEEVADCHLEYLHATPSRDAAGWKLDIKAWVHNGGPVAHDVRVGVRLEDNACVLSSAGVPAGETVELTGVLPCPDAAAYLPDDPRLYLLAAELAMDGGQPCDDLMERVGFREVRVEGGQVRFNGEPIAIRGFNRHEDHPLFGCALPFEAMCRDLALMKDLGANAVRTCHYPNDELFLDLCDEAGLLVWEENHARGLSEEQMRNPYFRQQCADCNRDMVMHHYNHPAIYLWGILNECVSDNEFGKSCYAEQLAQLRALDVSRPVSFASWKHFTDICLDLVDVVTFNIYPGWYVEESPEAYIERLYRWVQEETAGAGKPFLITEIGAGGLPGFHSAARVKWSEERQADILQTQLSAILQEEALMGVYVWQFCDCRVDEAWFEKRPRCMNNKGVVDEYRRPKLAYGTVRELFRWAGTEKSNLP